MKHQQSPLLRALAGIDFSAIFIIIACGIAVGVLQHRPAVQRPIFTQDATIAYKYMGASEMPFPVALVVPFVLLLATAIVVEFWLLKLAPGSMAQRVLLFINVLLGFFAAVAVVALITELFKRICGRLRPDFLDRCQPLELSDNTAVPFGTFPNTVCQSGRKASVLADGHMSFPSGHSSCSMAASLYAALYLMHCLYFRSGGAAAAALARPAGSLAGRLAAALAELGLLLLLLFELVWPWGVAASRFIDNRHNVSDVVAGLLLGATFTPLFVLRLAARCDCISSLQPPPGSGHILPVAAGEAGAVGPGRHPNPVGGGCELVPATAAAGDDSL